MKILIVTPYNEINIKEAVNIINSANKDFKLNYDVSSLGIIASLLSKKEEWQEKGFTSAYLYILDIFENYKDIFSINNNTIIIGNADKRKKFDYILGIKQEIVTTQETFIQTTRFKNILKSIYTSKDVQIWFNNYGELINFLKKGQ